MTLISHIKAYIVAHPSESIDWEAVANAMQAVVETAPRRLCYAVESGAAIEAVGDNRRAVQQAMLGDPDGLMLFQKLSSSAGVEWAHPATVAFLDAFVAAGVLSEAGKNALIELSAPTANPYAGISATACASIYEADQIQSRRRAFDAAVVSVRAEISVGAVQDTAGIIARMADALGIEG